MAKMILVTDCEGSEGLIPVSSIERVRPDEGGGVIVFCMLRQYGDRATKERRYIPDVTLREALEIINH